MTEQKRKIYNFSKSDIHIYREMLRALMEMGQHTKNGDSFLYHFIVLYANASIGGEILRGHVHMRVEELRRKFRMYQKEELKQLLQRMQDKGLITEFYFSKDVETHRREYVDIQLSEEYTHYVNRRGRGVKKKGYILLTMDAVDKILGMANSVTEMDAYLDLLFHVVVRDRMVEFSEFPIVCLKDTGRNCYPVSDDGDDNSQEYICYEPSIRYGFLAKRWKVTKKTVSVRIDKWVSAGLLTRVSFRTSCRDYVNLLFVPDAMITGDAESMEAIGAIDEEFIRFEADRHMEIDDYYEGEHRVKDGTVCIMTKDNPKGETKLAEIPEPAASEERERVLSDTVAKMKEEQKDDNRTESLEGYGSCTIIISAHPKDKREKIKKLIHDLINAAKEKHERKRTKTARERPPDRRKTV